MNQPLPYSSANLKTLTKYIKLAAKESDDLRKEPWRGCNDFLAGMCYIISEAVFHLFNGTKSGLKPMFVKVGNTSHWYLQDSHGKIIDPTAKQFANAVPYHLAKGKGFLTKNPSKRAQILMNRTKKILEGTL